MKRIVLISCVSKKLSTKAKAQELYTSSLFKKNLAYAKKQNPDEIFILSAKYGLLTLNKEIEPYDLTLNTMKNSEVKQWAENVLRELKQVSNLDEDEIIFLAGEKYRKFLEPSMKNYRVPLKGLSIGNQLKWLKARTNE